MSPFASDVPRRFLRPRSDTAVLDAALSLVSTFRRQFPDVIFDIVWESDTVNARAFMRADDRHVRLYGGLLRHRAIGSDGIAFSMAHELGHHFGGPPRHWYFDWMSTECQADRWAMRTGLPKIVKRVPGLRVSRGIEEIARVSETFVAPNELHVPRNAALAALAAGKARPDCYCGDCRS